MALPRFRCAEQIGFIPGPQGWRRLELDDEFDYVEEQFTVTRNGEQVLLPPGAWWDPVNDEAVALAETLVKQKKRKSIVAEHGVDMVPVQPPKSGISLSIEAQNIHSPNVDFPAPSPKAAAREAPKRRARAS